MKKLTMIFAVLTISLMIFSTNAFADEHKCCHTAKKECCSKESKKECTSKETKKECTTKEAKKSETTEQKETKKEKK